MEVDNKEKRHFAQLIKMDSSQEPQEVLSLEEMQIKNKLLDISGEIEEIYSRVIATCIEPLFKEEIRNGVGPLGRDFICHILKETCEADAAFFPTGGIRMDLKPGPITLGTIFNLIPSDRLVTYNVSGAWLRQLMLDGERRWATQMRTFQNHGIEIDKFTQEITVNGKPLKDEFIYRVSGSSFFFERELMDSNGNLQKKYEGMIDPSFEEYHEEIRAVIVNWLEDNELPPYIQHHETNSWDLLLAQ